MGKIKRKTPAGTMAVVGTCACRIAEVVGATVDAEKLWIRWVLMHDAGLSPEAAAAELELDDQGLAELRTFSLHMDKRLAQHPKGTTYVFPMSLVRCASEPWGEVV